jgi:hypothetical protein
MADYRIKRETQAHIDLAQDVYEWMQGRNMQQLSNYAAKFNVSVTHMREVIDLLISHGKVASSVYGGKRIYGAAVPQTAMQVKQSIYQFRPLQPNKQIQERMAEIEEQRAKYPSKHI